MDVPESLVVRLWLAAVPCLYNNRQTDLTHPSISLGSVAAAAAGYEQEQQQRRQ
jgi:hypothetical protein